uniref:Uncharacterized protein n=1 Tax=Amphimedon queenslandica TaxID=400682 RepID=A0A1X7V9J6_AMPQE
MSIHSLLLFLNSTSFSQEQSSSGVLTSGKAGGHHPNEAFRVGSTCCANSKSICLCGDYEVMINPVLLPDIYPLPRVDNLLAACKSFSKLDLKHAHLQVPKSLKSTQPLTSSKGFFSMNAYFLACPQLHLCFRG